MKTKSQSKRKPGRPTGLTEAIQQAICERIEKGFFLEPTVRELGLAESTVWEWLKRGEREPDSVYSRFRDAYLTADAKGENTWTQVLLRKALDGQPDAVQKVLAKRWPKRWRDTQHIETKISKDVEGLSNSELARKLREQADELEREGDGEP